MSQQTKAPERIELPGCYWAPEGRKADKVWWGHILAPNGVCVMRNVPQHDAERLAAAMNTQPSHAPVVRSAEVEQAIVLLTTEMPLQTTSNERRRYMDAGRRLAMHIAQLEARPGVQPSQSAVECAREVERKAWEGGPDEDDKAFSPDIAATLIQSFADAQQAAPVVRQSDEQRAREIVWSIGRNTMSEAQMIANVMPILAAHRKADGEALREALQPLLAMADKVTPGRYECAEVTDKDLWYECPMCSGGGEVQGDQYINFDGAPLNVLFSGIGDEHVKWQKLFDAFLVAVPKLKAALSQPAKGEL